MGGVCGCVCLREITSWLWINQERNDRSSCHYVEKTQSIHICVRLLMRWEMRFALHYYKYHITYSSRSLPHKEAAILSGSLWMWLHSHWMTPKPSFYTTFMMPHQTPVSHVLVLSGPDRNAHFEVVPMILIFRSECSGHYWVIAKPHASLLFFLFHAHTYTQMHQSAQHGTRWGSLKSQSHTCSPTHRVHTHTLALALTLSLLSRGDFILNWQSQPEEKI